jgi:6,7-dimethyl-8-ribityllumazine synthase
VTDVEHVDPSEATPGGLHVGVVAASWNRSITDNLAAAAVDRLEDLGVGRVTILRVPGSLELPIGAAGLAAAGCDAVVALGAIVRGDTDHYNIVAAESARGLTLVALEHGIPVANGILAVHDIQHAVDRSQPGPSNKGFEAATAGVEAALALTSLRQDRSSK